MTPLAPALPLADLTEKQWQAQAIQTARTLGWSHIYHTFNSRRSAHGFPDLVLVRDRCLFLELKTERGKLSEPQKEWLRALHAADCEAYVARPHDLDALAVVLAARRRYGDFPSGPAGERARVAASALHVATREEIR